MGNVDCEDIMAGDEFKVPQIKYYTQEMVKKFSELDYQNLKVMFTLYVHIFFLKNHVFTLRCSPYAINC